MQIKVIDKTSLLNGGIYEVIEEHENGYFIRCHSENSREFVLKSHSQIIDE